jgi:hypothetical protein
MCVCIKLYFPFYRGMAEVNMLVSLKILIAIS